jgi:Ca2+-binding EF-hand superfamily protein
LSIISLGGSNEKARFLFDLFDLDRDGYLSAKELTLLLTQVISSWLCPDTVTKATNRLRQQWVDF